MRGHHLFLCMTAAISWPCTAQAAEALKFGKPPEWVTPAAIPGSNPAPADAPVAMLLSDQQVAFEPGRMVAFNQVALKVQTAEGLAAGNISIMWNPATETVTVNKLNIRRGNQVIDVLAAGQTFTTLRREANLEAAMLDGMLTASIQPEGIQIGDVIEFATTTEHVDPVLKDHVEAMFGQWNGAPVALGNARLIWPKTMRVQVRQSDGLPAVRPTERGGMNVLEIKLPNIEPLLTPKGAPPRYSIGRLGEATDFQSWAELADLLAPHYRQAAVLPASGPLRQEVGRIRAESNDPMTRAEKALDLVQNRVRYVALLMGQGGYVPASAETTWSRRFGDCKGKTALLLAILRELGIEADPVLVSTSIGDALPERLPMISLFDHVIVRATIGGRTYWLDGTRTGDGSLDRMPVPDFAWGLPVAPNSKLVAIEQRPLTEPRVESAVTVDARAGAYAPAPFTARRTFRGDTGRSLNSAYAGMSTAQVQQMLRDYWKENYDYVTVKSVAFQYDKSRAELRLDMSGEARLEWKDGWFYVPDSSLAFEADFDRPPGPHQDAPFATSFPFYATSRVSIHLPPGFATGEQKLPAAVKETLAGVEYARSLSIKDGVLSLETSERSLVPEVPYKEAVAAESRLNALYDDDIYLRLPFSYRPTEADVAALLQTKPSSAADYFLRGSALLMHNKTDQALADLNAGLALDPKNAWALVKRAMAHLGKEQFAEAERDLRAAEAIEPGQSDLLASWAELARRKGDVAAALQAYDRVAKTDRNYSHARVGRAMILLQQGKEEEALRDLDAALVADPRNIGALAYRALVQSSRQDWNAAEKDMAAALALDPGNAAALVTKATIAAHRRDYDTALEIVSQALKSNPTDPFALRLQSQLLKREGNEQEARRLFDEAVARAPGDVTALLDRASARMEAKEFEAAQEDIAAALAVQPKNPRALEARGNLALARGDYKGAVDAITAALEAVPSGAPFLAQRAEAYRRLGEYDRALADADAASRAGLDSPSLRLMRINILLAKGEPQRVAEETDGLLQQNPSSDFALVAAGKTYAAIGMTQKAMDAFDRAIAMRPYAYIYVNRAQARPYSDVAGRLADLDAALKLESDHPDALAEKARLLSRLGQHSEAIQLYDRAMELALDGSYLEVDRAIALHRAGRAAEAAKVLDDERGKARSAADFNRLCRAKAMVDALLGSALEDCREALRRSPDFFWTLESLGIVLLKLGKVDEALAAFEQAVARNPAAGAYLGRALAHARKGDRSRAVADAAEARRLRARIDDEFAEFGLKLENLQTIASPAEAAPASLQD